MTNPGDILGGFQLVRQLGEGPFGMVWQAQDAQRVSVALKLLKPAFIQRHTGQAAFSRLVASIQRHRMLQHPKVAVVYGPLQDPQRSELGMSTEFVDGRLLTEVQLRSGPQGHDLRSIGRLLDWMIMLGDTLAWLHGHGVVHGNIKPSNVMLVRGPSGYDVKLLDLVWSAIGLAAPQPGTPTFLAPEQLRGSPPSIASDQWSWARLMERALQGWNPQAGLPEISPVLRNVLRRATAEAPEQRFTSLVEPLGIVRAVRGEMGRSDEPGGTPLPTMIESPLVAPGVQMPYGYGPTAGYGYPAPGVYPPGYGPPYGYPAPGAYPPVPQANYPYPASGMNPAAYPVAPTPPPGYPPASGYNPYSPTPDSAPPVPQARPGPQDTAEIPAMPQSPRVRPLIPAADTGELAGRVHSPGEGSIPPVSTPPPQEGSIPSESNQLSKEGSIPPVPSPSVSAPVATDAPSFREVPLDEVSIPPTDLQPKRRWWPILAAVLMFVIGGMVVMGLRLAGINLPFIDRTASSDEALAVPGTEAAPGQPSTETSSASMEGG